VNVFVNSRIKAVNFLYLLLLCLVDVVLFSLNVVFLYLIDIETRADFSSSESQLTNDSSRLSLLANRPTVNTS